jgi:ABC-type transport system involved in Fe-S cluster assembly fused permease/ATPase subunit
MSISQAAVSISGPQTKKPAKAKKDVSLRIGPALLEVFQVFWLRQGATVRLRVVAALLCLIFARFANVYVPVLFKHLIDTLSSDSVAKYGVPIMLILAYGFSRLAVAWLNELREIMLVKAARSATRDLAVRAFDHVHTLGPSFLLEQKVGALTERISRGVGGVRQIVEYLLFSALPTLFEICLVIGVLWGYLNVWFSAVTLITVAIYVVFSITVTEWRIKYRKQMNGDYDQVKSWAVDSLLNFESVICFNNLSLSSARYRRALEKYEDSSLRSVMSLSMVNVGQGLIISTGLTIILFMAATGLSEGAMTVGAFVMVGTYLLQLFQPLNMLGFTYRQIRQGLIDLGDLLNLLEQKPAVAEAPGATPLAVRSGSVKFDNISFQYANGVSVLDNVSFEVPAGKTLAIVGESGSGKTTLGRLLLRFYDVQQGSVRIDDQDVRNVTLASLHQAIGLVSQDTILFNDTLRYNITYGRPDATDAEVNEAIKVSRLSKLIASLPGGDTARVGERGLKISGGERQRVAIARIILKNAPILLLDEATSSLDSVTERDIMESFQRISDGRTTIIIAHRLSTVVGADQIIVLDKGRIAETGTHESLRRAGGLYDAMWQRQRQEEAGRGQDLDSATTPKLAIVASKR